MIDLPTPSAWLDTMLERHGPTTQNRYGEKHGIPSSSMSKFKTGRAGPELAIDVALAFRVSPMTTLAICGHIPPPPRSDDLVWADIQHIYQLLPSADRRLLRDMAQCLAKRRSEPDPIPSGGA